MSDHTDDREARKLLDLLHGMGFHDPEVNRPMRDTIRNSIWLKEHDAKVAADAREAGRVEGRNEVAASVEATLGSQAAKAQCYGQHERFSIEQIRAAVSDVGVDAHNRAIKAQALREAAKDLSAKAVQRFDESGPNDARGAAIWDCARWLDEDRADATERGGLMSGSEELKPGGKFAINVGEIEIDGVIPDTPTRTFDYPFGEPPIAGSAPSKVCIVTEDGRSVVTFYGDGRLEFGEGFPPGEAGAEFVDAVECAWPARLTNAKAEALHDAAVAALGMHDPPAPDCAEWAAWLDARAQDTKKGKL